jgi:hypothetical protein
MLTDKKSEVVYCRFASRVYDLVKSRARSWGVTNADAIQRLAYIGDMVLSLVESIGQGEGNGQAPCLNTIAEAVRVA